MRIQAVSLSTVLGLLFLSHTVTALKCYVCIKCNDPFQSNSKDLETKGCSGACVKLKAETHGVIDGEAVKEGDVVRGCSDVMQKAECKKTEILGIKGKFCYCDKDLCNGSNTLTVSMATGIMATAATALKLFL